MTDVLPSTPRVVIFAPCRDGMVNDLNHALTARSISVSIVTTVAEGLNVLGQLTQDLQSHMFVLLLGAIEGLHVLDIAKAIRGLPQCSAMPLIVIESLPHPLSRCRSIDVPIRAEHLECLLATNPSRWLHQLPPDARQITTTPSSPVILIVDDSPVNLLVLRRQVESLGYRVDTCANGELALGRIAVGGIDLVLMDCQMPIMNGYEAATLIRQSETTTHQHLPVIAITANATLSNRERCFAIGMDGILIKPINRERLREMIHQWLIHS